MRARVQRQFLEKFAKSEENRGMNFGNKSQWSLAYMLDTLLKYMEYAW